MTDISKEELQNVIKHFIANRNRMRFDVDHIDSLSDKWFDFPKYFVPNAIIEQLVEQAAYHDGDSMVSLHSVLSILDLRSQINNFNKQENDK